VESDTRVVPIDAGNKEEERADEDEEDEGVMLVMEEKLD
jgi:hypothetical protein